MILSSGTFLVFLTVCLIGHYILPHKARNFWLFLSSVAFFCYAMPAQALILMVFCLVIWLFCPAMAAAKHQLRKVLLWGGIGLGIGFLVFYKYLAFLASSLGLPTTSAIFSLVAPMGISYVTFQCIAYLVEVYKGRMEPEKDPIDFFVYALFFAKLTAGPIETPQAFLAQLKQPRQFSLYRAKKGLLRMAMGFVKKIAVADYLAIGVAAVFEKGGQAEGWAVIMGSCMYAVQLLCDFSGYTDIARGAASLFGIELTENFNAPYMATSVRDFWRRWHISLSTWLKNYIYIPLGGSRVGTVRRYCNVMVTFLVSGIWHGASLSYVFWGLLHGIYQVAEMLLEPVGRRLRATIGIRDDHPVRIWICRGVTFILVTTAWVFFRADSIGTALDMLGCLFAPWGSFNEAAKLCGMDFAAVLLTVSGLLCAHLMGKLLALECKKQERNSAVTHICVCIVWAVLLVYMVCAAAGGGSSFIYFDF